MTFGRDRWPGMDRPATGSPGWLGAQAVTPMPRPYSPPPSRLKVRPVVALDWSAARPDAGSGYPTSTTFGDAPGGEGSGSPGASTAPPSTTAPSDCCG